MAQAQQTWRIGVDIGGTFTDLVLASSAGTIEVFKVPTVPADPSRGALAAVESAATAKGLEVEELLSACTLFVHGTTVATNIVLEGKGAKVGMLTTEGFRDSLEIRRGMRQNPWDHRTPFPPVLVPRHLRLPVKGRIDREGDERSELALLEVRNALHVMQKEGVEAIAIALFNSYANPLHEQEAASVIAASAPEIMLSVSSAVAPVMGEFERASTAVLNAYVSPKTLTYLRSLGKSLSDRGLTSPLVIVQSNGGAVSVDELGDRSVTLLLSGPAAGVGAMKYYQEATASNNLVSIEIGGTSCDVILMNDGEFASIDLLDIGGYKCVTPSIDVHTIGAGGGTIAHVDSANFLQVGPQGAGARPGPACYGFGGTEPTITDAQVALGRLKPGPYADGAVTIDKTLAEAAIRTKIAEPLGMTIEQAAAGIIELMEQKLLHAVQRVSTERGHNPERFTLIAAGGAGPLHAASVGRAMNCAAVFVPKLSGAFCALGMLNANLQHDYMSVLLARLDEVSRGLLEDKYRVLEGKALDLLAREGFLGDRALLERALDLRYVGQQWDVTVAVEGSFDPTSIRVAFEQEYERLFGHTQPEGLVEITKLRVVGKGLMPAFPAIVCEARVEDGKPVERRNVWLDRQAGWRETPIYDGGSLRSGQIINGPAIINEQTTTVLVGSSDRLTVDAGGNYKIETML